MDFPLPKAFRKYPVKGDDYGLFAHQVSEIMGGVDSLQRSLTRARQEAQEYFRGAYTPQQKYRTEVNFSDFKERVNNNIRAMESQRRDLEKVLKLYNEKLRAKRMDLPSPPSVLPPPLAQAKAARESHPLPRQARFTRPSVPSGTRRTLHSVPSALPPPPSVLPPPLAQAKAARESYPLPRLARFTRPSVPSGTRRTLHSVPVPPPRRARTRGESKRRKEGKPPKIVFEEPPPEPLRSRLPSDMSDIIERMNREAMERLEERYEPGYLGRLIAQETREDVERAPSPREEDIGQIIERARVRIADKPQVKYIERGFDPSQRQTEKEYRKNREKEQEREETSKERKERKKKDKRRAKKLGYVVDKRSRGKYHEVPPKRRTRRNAKKEAERTGEDLDELKARWKRESSSASRRRIANRAKKYLELKNHGKYSSTDYEGNINTFEPKSGEIVEVDRKYVDKEGKRRIDRVMANKDIALQWDRVKEINRDKARQRPGRGRKAGEYFSEKQIIKVMGPKKKSKSD